MHYNKWLSLSEFQRELQKQDIETQLRMEIFKYSCHYCLYHKHPSEDSYENIRQQLWHRVRWDIDSFFFADDFKIIMKFGKLLSLG